MKIPLKPYPKADGQREPVAGICSGTTYWTGNNLLVNDCGRPGVHRVELPFIAWNGRSAIQSVEVCDQCEAFLLLNPDGTSAAKKTTRYADGGE